MVAVDVVTSGLFLPYSFGVTANAAAFSFHAGYAGWWPDVATHSLLTGVSDVLSVFGDVRQANTIHSLLVG